MTEETFFIKTGDPNACALPKWPVYTPAKKETMVLNDSSEVKNDPDKMGRESLPVARLATSV